MEAYKKYISQGELIGWGGGGGGRKEKRRLFTIQDLYGKNDASRKAADLISHRAENQQTPDANKGNTIRFRQKEKFGKNSNYKKPSETTSA